MLKLDRLPIAVFVFVGPAVLEVVVSVDPDCVPLLDTRVDVMTGDVAEGVNVAVPSSTVIYVPFACDNTQALANFYNSKTH